MDHDEDRALDLLLGAVDTLEPADRAEVLRFLIRRGLHTPPAPAYVAVGSSLPGLPGPGFLNVRPEPGSKPDAPGKRLQGTFGYELGVRTPQQMVPVRFTAEAHQRLRGWCGDNGFAMAAVVRGLVDQFLDAQQVPAPATGPETTEAPAGE